jgi:hypothetical protein
MHSKHPASRKSWTYVLYYVACPVYRTYVRNQTFSEIPGSEALFALLSTKRDAGVVPPVALLIHEIPGVEEDGELVARVLLLGKTSTM